MSYRLTSLQISLNAINDRHLTPARSTCTKPRDLVKMSQQAMYRFHMQQGTATYMALLHMNDQKIFLYLKMKDLCLIFDNYLVFHEYISGICKFAQFHFCNIGRIRILLTLGATYSPLSIFFTLFFITFNKQQD